MAKGSRSERKAGRQRAERARAHGLPEARPVEHRAIEALDTDTDADSGPLPAGVPQRGGGGRPALPWVVGGALLILAFVYLLKRFRDGH
jgi:hypothetical protein